MSMCFLSRTFICYMQLFELNVNLQNFSCSKFLLVFLGIFNQVFLIRCYDYEPAIKPAKC